MKSFALVLIGLFVTFNSFGQKSTINGKITEKNEALMGATVMVKGTNIGAFADLDGTFSIDVSNYDGGSITLKILYTGYETAEVHFETLEEALKTFTIVNYKKPKKFKVTQTSE